jgi:hypothetical protein
MCCLTAGCGVFGALAHKVVGDPPVPAQYVPPQTPMLVWVENYGAPGSARLESEQLALAIEHELRARNVAPLVDATALRDEHAQRPDSLKRLTIPALGAKAGARQVVYVHLSSGSIEQPPASDAMRASASARVRVVDVASGQTVWPLDLAEGFEILVEAPYQRLGPGVNELTLRQQLRRSLAERIARLFYNFKPN